MIIDTLKDLYERGIISDEIVFNYTVAEGFEKTDGKFTNTLGNLAIVDCHSIAKKMAINIYDIADAMANSGVIKYKIAAPYVREVGDFVNASDVC